jgi:PAS domain S-box-containing protein
MKINFSVRSFLIFLAICFTTLPVLLFGVYEARSGVERANEDARKMNGQAARVIEHDISATIEQFKTLFSGLAVDVNLGETRFSDPARINELLKSYSVPVSIFLLNDRAVSVSTYSATAPIPAGIDYSGLEHIDRARATRQIAISGNLRSRTTSLPSVVFSIPLIAMDGTIAGFLNGAVPPEAFQITYALAPDQFALVLDAYGREVSAINAREVEALATAVAAAPVGPSRAQPNQVDTHLYAAPVQPVGWKVVVGLPDSYVVARARQAVRSAALVAVFCGLLGAGIASLVTPNFKNILEHTARARQAELEAISQLADTILIARFDGQITYVNDAGTRLFGEALGKQLKDLIGSDNAARVLSLEQPRAWKGEVAGRKNNGAIFDGFLSSTPILENGKLKAIVAIVQDITHEKAARDAVTQSEKMITLGELVAGTSHELNNPLAIVTGYSDLLLEDGHLSADQRSKVDSIRKSALRAANVVHSLLAFARKRKPERVRTEVNPVVDAAVRLKEYDLRTSGIQLEKELCATLPPVFADPHQIQQVLLNVINNAQDAVMSGSPSPKILVKTETYNHVVRIRIEDNGPGISKVDLKKVFNPFFTTKPVGKGTGLGLSISYGIIREHGGEIDIQSQVGQGTQVCIELPVDDAGPREAARRAVIVDQVVPRNFLVVDDEPEIVTIIHSALSRRGSMVDTAGNLEDALALARKNDYDFIITDIKMPGGSGIDLYKQLCTVNPSYRRRVVFLTGDTSNLSTLQFLEQEGLLYFAKPFDFQAMEKYFSGQV